MVLWIWSLFCCFHENIHETTMQVSSQLRMLVHIEWLSAPHLWVQKVLWRSNRKFDPFRHGCLISCFTKLTFWNPEYSILRKLNHHFLSDKRVLGIFPSTQVLKLLVVDFQKWCGYPQLFILLQVNIQGTHIYEDQKSDTSEIWGLCADQSITVCCRMLTPVCSSRPAEITAQTCYLLYLEFVLCSKGSLVPTGHTTHTHLHIWPPVGKKCTIKSKCSFFGFFKYSNDLLTSLWLYSKHTA